MSSLFICMKARFYLTIAGLFLLAGGLIGSQYVLASAKGNAQPVAPVSSTLSIPQGATLSGVPQHLAIPSVHISVGIDQGTYIASTKTWTLGETRPSYATNTPLPNTQGGNTYMYGHNRAGIFANLPKVQPGAKAIVTTTNGHMFIYQMVSVKDVKPTDTSLFDYRGSPILTLQTCTGLFYQNRHLVTFKLVGAS